MIVVLDTSAAVEIVLQRGKAKSLREAVGDAEQVLAPTLYVSELTSVFWKYCQFGELTQDISEEGLQRGIRLPDEFVPDEELYKEAFALGCLAGKPVYDMFFLVLARRMNGYLLTMDRSLRNTAKTQGVRTLP